MNFTLSDLAQLANAQWDQVEKARKEVEEGKHSEFYDLLLNNYERQVNLWEKIIRFKNA